MSNFIQLFLQPPVLTQMRTHQAFPERPMVRHGEVQKLVHDDVVADLLAHGNQFGIEIQIAGRG